jgi:transposase
VVRVSGKGSGRVSIAGLVAYRPGHRGHFYYRVVVHRGRAGERRSFCEAGYAALLSAAHQQLHAPLIVVWDNLNTHTSVKMRAFITAHSDWLAVVRLPAYAPDLNAAEGAWAHLKHGLGNLAVTGIDQLVTVVKNHLKRIQYRPELLDGFLTQTELTLDPAPP